MQFLYIRFPIFASAFKNRFFVFVNFLNVYILEHQCTAGIPVNNCIWKFIFPQETYSCHILRVHCYEDDIGAHPENQTLTNNLFKYTLQSTIKFRTTILLLSKRIFEKS